VLVAERCSDTVISLQNVKTLNKTFCVAETAKPVAKEMDKGLLSLSSNKH